MQSSTKEASPERLANFFKSLSELQAQPHVASSAREAVDILKEIVAKHDVKQAAIAGLPLAARMVVDAALKGTLHKAVEDLSGPELVDFVSKCDLGVTWAEFGVSDQGAVVEVVYDDAVKLASSLPFTHVALLSSRRILADLPTAMGEVATLVRGSAGQKKPLISFISGPSKTADIEMRLLYGVHGPNAVHVLVLDWL